MKPIYLFIIVVIGVAHATLYDQVSITIDTKTNPRSQIVPPYFASFSCEWSIIHYFSGSAVVNLFNELKQWTGASPYLRVGGDSTDSSFYNPTNGAAPVSGWFSISDTILSNLNTFAVQTGAKLILGLNFHNATSAAIAISELQGINKHFNWSTIHAMEIGNEQDLYTSNGIRPSNFTAAQFQAQYSYYISQLIDYAVTGVKLPTNRIFQGGAICCEAAFENAAPTFIIAEEAYTPTYSQHYYSGNACNSHPTLSCGAPTADLMRRHLLADSNTRQYAHPLRLILRHTSSFWRFE